MTLVDVTSVSSIMRDMYPCPGDRIKQWVVDTWRESEWERATCPKFDVIEHDDNTGLSCRNAGLWVPWTHLAHDCCYDCCDQHDAALELPSVQAWLAEKAKRPPIEADRTKLSDEVQRNYLFDPHPMLAMVKK